MITIQHLQIIDKVISEGSVTKAAARLHLTQSALSHQIKDLEEALGLRLFHRSGKKMILTAAGRKVVESAAVILPHLQHLHEELGHLKAGKSRQLRISTECYTCYNWLPATLHQFHQKHAQVNVEIVVEATQKPLQYLEQGKLDLAIVSRRHPDSPLQYKHLFDDNLVVVVPPTHPLAALKKPLQPSQLEGETLLLYQFSKDTPAYTFLEGVHFKQLIKMPLTETILEMVKAGMGITIMANWAAKNYAANHSLVLVPLDHTLSNRSWYACFHKDADDAVKEMAEEIAVSCEL